MISAGSLGLTLILQVRTHPQYRTFPLSIIPKNIGGLKVSKISSFLIFVIYNFLRKKLHYKKCAGPNSVQKKGFIPSSIQGTVHLLRKAGDDHFS